MICATPLARRRQTVRSDQTGLGSIVPLLPVTLLLPLPCSHIIPALVIMLASFAYLEEAGVLLWMSLAAALAPFAITAATVRRRSERRVTGEIVVGNVDCACRKWRDIPLGRRTP
jgi:hypothetical protein